MEHEEHVRALRSTAFFGRLRTSTLQRLAGQVTARRHERDDLLCSEGYPAESLLVLASGRFSVYCTSAQGQRVGLGLLTAPSVHLEMAVLDGSARTCSVQALGPSASMRLPRVHLLELLVSERDLLEPVAALLGQLVRGLTERIVDQVVLDLETRVVKTLLVLAGGRRSVLVTQRQLAELVGGTRQSVNQVLGELAHRGLVALDRSQVLLLHPDRLAVLAGLEVEAPERPARVVAVQRTLSRQLAHAGR